MKLSRRGKTGLLYLTIVLVMVGCLATFKAASLTMSKASGEEPPLRWDPRKTPDDNQFVGDHVCAKCHKVLVDSYSRSPMKLAMEDVANSRVLTANPVLSFRNGKYSYEIKRNAKQSLYTVTDGNESVTVPILYAFGQGKAGQTYLFRYEGELYQSLVSFYDEVGNLDLTVGASHDAPTSLKDALGRRLSEQETKNCFECHGTLSLDEGKINFEEVITGISCETCHGPGGAHATEIQAKRPGKDLIFNPTRLSGDELSQEFCSSCHRAINDFEKLRFLQVNNIRFQPYRIFKSKCYSDDRRIRCTACHDPHEPVSMDSAYYDKKCLACHVTRSKSSEVARLRPGSDVSCKVGTNKCVSCHMKKHEPPQAHFKFTDHYIRIIRPGEAYAD